MLGSRGRGRERPEAALPCRVEGIQACWFVSLLRDGRGSFGGSGAVLVDSLCV